jgi:hypothetical protein
MRIRNLIVGAIVAASMLTTAAPAFAQTASDGYTPGPRGSIQERISTERRDPPDQITETRSSEARSELPFTGLDVALIIGAGGVLLAMGFGMRRLSRTEVA